MNKLIINNRKNIICQSYYDRVSYDANNNIFYIYYLGKYNNRKTYCYGETNDISIIELKLKQSLPIYKLIRTISKEDKIYDKNNFEKIIKNNKIDFPIKELNNDLSFFYLDNENLFKKVMVV